MALETSKAPRYTDEHAKAGLDFAFPAIETWQNQFPGYEILIDDPELTSVCPKTGLPDFGVLTIRYMPRERCLELKSLKEYLFSYRNLGIFQENIVNQVLEDVVKACDPVWAVVHGEFRPRGGIGTTVEARWPRPRPEAVENRAECLLRTWASMAGCDIRCILGNFLRDRSLLPTSRPICSAPASTPHWARCCCSSALTCSTTSTATSCPAHSR